MAIREGGQVVREAKGMDEKYMVIKVKDNRKPKLMYTFKAH